MTRNQRFAISQLGYLLSGVSFHEPDGTASAASRAMQLGLYPFTDASGTPGGGGTDPNAWRLLFGDPPDSLGVDPDGEEV